MAQPIQYHHQAQYIHYTPPQQVINGNAGVAPQDTTRQVVQQYRQPPPPPPQQHQQAANVSTGGGTGTGTPLVATGDWTKDLVHLAKTAELKKHALTLQLHTAHILSAHASLQEKSKAIQDIREQKNKLESERTKLLNMLREINEDRDKADIMESTIERECHEIRSKMNQLTESEYAVAKSDVDRLRQELGQEPLPSLQTLLDEKSNQYLNERRLSGNTTTNNQNNLSHIAGSKRDSADIGTPDAPSGKRPRGRPKGSKNRNKEGGAM